MDNQEDIKRIDALLKQLKKAGSDEAQAAQLMLKNGMRFEQQAIAEGPISAAAHSGWGVTFKAYGESVMYKPTTAALLGTAKSNVMIDRIDPRHRSPLAQMADKDAGVSESFE